MRRCAKCKETSMVVVQEPVKVTLDGRTFTGTIQSTKCKACGEHHVAFNAISTFEIAVARDLAVSAAIGGEGFKYMRKALGIKAEQLASLLDVSRETLSRWETNGREVPRMAWALLATIVLEGVKGPSPTMNRLVDFKEPPKLAKTNVAGELAAKRA